MLKKAQGNFDSLDAESKGMRTMLPILAEMDKDMPRIYSSLLAIRLSDFTQRSTGKVGDRTRAHELWKWHEEGMNIADKKQDDARNLIGLYKTKISDSKVMVKTTRWDGYTVSYRDPKKGEKTYQAWVDANKGLKKAEKDEKDATREYAIKRDLAEKEQKSFERQHKAGLAAEDPSALMDEALMELDNYKIKYTFEGEEMVDGAPKVTALSWVVNEEAIATKKASFWDSKKWTGNYDKAVKRRDEILEEFDGTGGKPNLNQIFPSAQEIKIANTEHGDVHTELVKLRSQIMETNNVSLFTKRNLAGAPLQQTDYVIKKFAMQQKAMKAYFSLFGNKYTYQIAVKKGDKYSWVNLGKGAQTHIIERAKKHGVHLSDDDVAFAKELDTLPTGSKSLLPSEANKIKRISDSTGDFDPDNVYATAPSGVLTVTGSSTIKRQVREGGPWDIGGVFRGGNWQGSVNYLPTGIAKDIQRMIRSQPPMSSSVAGRIIDAMSMGKAECI